MATYQLELTPVTPIHIGSGETIPGYEYFLDDYWYIYQLDQVLEALSETERKVVIKVATTNVMRLAGALQNYPQLLKEQAQYIGGYSENARQAWADSSADSSQAQALVQRFIHSQNRAYIPGSSLKGTLRTALLYAQLGTLDTPRAERDARYLEADAFGYEANRLTTDPFRFFKISDTTVMPEITDLRQVQRFAFKQDERRWDSQVTTLLECTQASLSRLQRSGDEDIVLRATLTIQEDANRAAQAANQRGELPWQFTMGNVLAACRHFSREHLAAEQNYVAGLRDAEGVYRQIRDYADQLPDHATLLRIGFGAGRDSKTINYLQPTPDVSRSRQLVDGIYPLGWLEMRIVTEDGEPLVTTSDDAKFIKPSKRQTLGLEEQRTKVFAAERAAAEKREERIQESASSIWEQLQQRWSEDGE